MLALQQEGVVKRWQHDCTNCVFVGSVKADAKWANGGTGYHRYDLYICPKDFGGGGELVARFGNEGPHYLAGMVRYESPTERRRNSDDYPLVMAWEAAHKAGLIKDDGRAQDR